MATSEWQGVAGRGGGFVDVEGERCYRIPGYDRMPPFLMSIASDTDLWMFVSSAGGLTAGRVDAEGALFPYETVDRLHDAHRHTGPLTLLRVRRADGAPVLWEPFRGPAHARIERTLDKNRAGNQLTFGETHLDLGLTFRQRWSGSDEFGLVRTAWLENDGRGPVAVDVLDGLRNLLPSDVPLALYQHSSCLVDAYKHMDVDPETRMGIVSLTSRIIDRPEAAEALRASIVWCLGLPRFEVALGAGAPDAFRSGSALPPERRLTGRRANYFVRASLALEHGARTQWHLVADVRRSHVQIEAMRVRLQSDAGLGAALEASLAEATRSLERNVASADGLQVTAHEVAAAHHFSNVLFNNMRGGVFAEHHQVPAADFREFVHARDGASAARHAPWLAALPAALPVDALRQAAAATGDAALERLAFEYLPIYFGRRHGDPSRPWNRFQIRVRNDDGSRALRYEGNWRDIFQNWEALARSFPAFLPNLVAKFVNASTADGYNPYRITRDGFDWEVADPDEPWSHIGYWGDHQIVYLLKLLEALEQHAPGSLHAMLHREVFSYADVPYRLKPYDEVVRDPHATIEYDPRRAAAIEARVRETGSDGKLVRSAEGAVHHVGLLEKLIVPVFTKLSNFVPDGGIWMNTQRPEWNDANNALVGHGASVVTLCYLRRHLAFLANLLESAPAGSARFSVEVARWFGAIRAIVVRLAEAPPDARVSDGDRRAWLDALGRAFSEYRVGLYAGGFSGERADVPVAELAAFCRTSLVCVDRSIAANLRDDGLYHAYNVLEFAPESGAVALRRLDVMLEGQVAALSSGLVSAPEAARLLDALFASALHRDDQDSFLLYPDRTLPSFLDRNRVPAEGLESAPLLAALHRAGDRSILDRDAGGTWRFHADFRNARDLEAALDRLAGRAEWTAAVTRDRGAVLALFERVFAHHAFTGRSGRMYGYEGLGSIYWHMVAKLLLAVQEQMQLAAEAGRPEAEVRPLVEAYHRVRAGLGFEKTAFEYGAFPTDPYSHTPAHAGAQQPGMTGQVKEEILTRFGEFGVVVRAGRVRFRPRLLRRREFLAEGVVAHFEAIDGRPLELQLPAGSLAFTFCQVPVVYHVSAGEARVRIVPRDGAAVVLAGDELDAVTSRSLLDRRGELERLDVFVPEAALLTG